MTHFPHRRKPRLSPWARRRRRSGGFWGVLAAATLAVCVSVVWVQSASSDRPGRPASPLEPTVVRSLAAKVDPGRVNAKAAILLEAETGTVLFEQNADAVRGPASLVKMMLQLLVFEDVAAGKVGWDQEIEASANASTMGGSQVFLKQGEKQTLAALIDAVAIASANDASMAIAEHLAGDEASFVRRMNERAAELGCENTTFVNVHGLDLRRQGRNVTTARDLGRIAAALVRHDGALEVASTWRKPFRGGEFWLDNTNKLLRKFDGLDGLKTGWTPRAGGCFVGTAERDEVRLVAVVLAAGSGRSRFQVAAKLLDAGFDAELAWVDALERGEVVVAMAPPAAAAQEAGEGQSAGLASLGALGGEDVVASSPAAVRAAGTVRVLVSGEDEARLTRRFRPREGGEGDSQVVGWLDVQFDGRTVATMPAHATASS